MLFQVVRGGERVSLGPSAKAVGHRITNSQNTVAQRSFHYGHYSELGVKESRLENRSR
jgi:hypothetical protein